MDEDLDASREALKKLRQKSISTSASVAFTGKIYNGKGVWSYAGIGSPESKPSRRR